MKGCIGIATLTLAALLVATAHGEVVLDGGGLLLAEQGGTFDAGNLSAGATPFALDELAYNGTVHFIADLNDGLYGNSDAWIGGGATGTSGPFVGISLGAAPTTVQSIAFGRDNGGEANPFSDRWDGLYTLQYTQVADPSGSTPDADWTTVGTLDYQSASGPGFDQPWLRHRYNFDAVEATGIRLMVPASGIAGGTCIDEVELYGQPGTVHEYHPYALTAEPGFSITWNGNEGDFFDPAAGPDQTGAPDNLALAANGAVVFGSSAYPAPAHAIEHATDGLYGNSNSWLSAPDDQSPFIGVDFAGADPVAVASLAFGRDNGNSEEPWGTEGQLTDRWPGVYTVQYTLLQDPDAATEDTGDAATGWATIGTIDLIRAGIEGEPLQEPWLRHLFELSYDGGPVMATGIRILAPPGNCIDELEVNPIPEPGTMLLLAIGGLGWLAWGLLRRGRFRA